MANSHIYTFDDGKFYFQTAHYPNGRRDVFRVRIDRVPRERAREKGIEGYTHLEPSTESERAIWFMTHPDYASQVGRVRDSIRY